MKRPRAGTTGVYSQRQTLPITLRAYRQMRRLRLLSTPLSVSSWRVAEARGIPAELARTAKQLLEDESRPKVVHDLKAARLKLGEMGIHLNGPVHDVMLYAFLLSADPGGCSCEVLAEKFLDRKLGASMDMRADCALELFSRSSTRRLMSADSEKSMTRSTCRWLMSSRLWNAPVFAWSPPSCRCSRRSSTPRCSGSSARDLRNRRHAVQHQLAAAAGEGAL